MNSALWADLVRLHMWGMKLVLCGDLAQFSAICDSWLGAPLSEDALARSDMLRELVACARYRLTENKRSDPQIFDFVTSLRPGEPGARDCTKLWLTRGTGSPSQRSQRIGRSSCRTRDGAR